MKNGKEKDSEKPRHTPEGDDSHAAKQTEKSAEDQDNSEGDDEHDHGGIPDRDLRRNLGCGG